MGDLLPDRLGQVRDLLFEEVEMGEDRAEPTPVAVADRIASVFAYFEALTSARQVMLRLASADRQVRWAHPTYKAIHDILPNPCYAVSRTPPRAARPSDPSLAPHARGHLLLVHIQRR